MQPLAITAGEPSGIGPDLIIKLAQEAWHYPIVAIGNANCFVERAKALGLSIELLPYCPDSDQAFGHGKIPFIDIETASSVEIGQLNSSNAKHVIDMLDCAIEGTLEQRFSAIVTAPISKAVINDYGLAFSGHTEYLAEKTQSDEVVMMLTTYEKQKQPLRIALATTHLPLKEVSEAITAEKIIRTCEITYNDLESKFGLSKPNIALAGLNPHAGENGYLGREEIETIIPALQQLSEQGIVISGPYPADTMFSTIEADTYIAMFHDQGLPVVKYAGFGNVVNVTLGLPIIRTSVDHGCALDLAGTGKIKTGSLKAAIELAVELVQTSTQHG